MAKIKGFFLSLAPALKKALECRTRTCTAYTDFRREVWVLSFVRKFKTCSFTGASNTECLTLLKPGSRVSPFMGLLSNSGH